MEVEELMYVQNDAALLSSEGNARGYK